MKAVVCVELGPPESLRLEERDPGPPGPGQARVSLRAAGLNFPDVLMIRGGYQLKPPLPFTPGTEAAGVVESVGDGVARFAPGDRVIVRMRFGAFAEAVVVPEEQLLPLPAPFSFEEGAAYMVGALTAWHALIDRGRLQAGETVLVHGAAGGVGLPAVQLARHLGARVIATAGTPEKRAAALANGAETAIDYRQGFREAVLDLTGGAGADVIYDPVGGAVFEESLRCIAWRGRLLVIGFTSGGYGRLPANYPLLKGCAVIGVRAGEAGRRDPGLGRRAHAAIMRLAEDGFLRPVISHRLPLAEVAKAMRLMLDRQVIGKAVLTMPG